MIAKRNDKAVTIRFPPEVVERLAEAAKENGRSRNTEVVVRLSDSLGMRKKRTRK